MLILFNNALVGATDFPFGSGNTISANAIVGKYTYLGDADLDGQVTSQDYTAIDANLGTNGLDLGVSWFYGDMDFDGNITTADYTGIDSALGFGQGNPLSLSAQSVPEPSAIFSAIALATSISLTRRQRRTGGTPR
jgi:hypothetical protein